MTLFTWTAESRSFLNNETRIQQFDFERVAKAVRDRFSHLSCEVSPDQCRLAFAEDFTSTLPPDIMRETSMLNIDDSMSFDQVMNIVEIRNERNELRKKKTFDRILASLGPMTVSSVSGSDEHTLIKSNMAEKRMQEEHERCRRNEITAKKNEISRVEMEREILRQRKLAPTSGSLDEGMPQHISMPHHFDAESDLKYIDKAEDYISDDSDDMDNDYDYDPSGLMMDEDLDAVLEEVEKDIDSQAEAKGLMRNMGERSELYEVLALLEMSSISKKKEEKYVKKTQQPVTTDCNDDEDNHNDNDYNDNDHSNDHSRNVNSHRNNSNDTLRPFRISSMSAPVLAHKSSYLPVQSNKSSVDAISGEERKEEQELSLPSDEAVGDLESKGVCAEQYLKINNRDGEKSILSSDELESACTSSSRSSTMIKSAKKMEHEEVRNALCVCDSDGEGDSDSDSDGDGEDSQESDDWVDSRHSLKMKALLYRSPPVPPSVPDDLTSPEIDAMYASTTQAMPERESTTEVEVEGVVGRIQITSQSADQRSSGVAQAASTHSSTISTPIPIDVHEIPLQDTDSTLTLPCDQRSSLATSNPTPTTPTSDPSRTYDVYDRINLQDKAINEEKRPQLQMSGSLLGRRSGSRSAAALRTLRPPGVPVPLA